MLKITIHTLEGSSRIALEGRLAGPWVEEVERCWRDTKATAEGTLVVDLTGVTFIEPEGKALLSRLWQDGAKLLASGCCMRSIVDDIMSAGREAPSNSSSKKGNRR